MEILLTILSIIGIILLAILLLILILLVTPVGVKVSYNSGFEEFLLKIKIGFLEIPINLGSKKVQKKVAKTAKTAAKETEEEAKKEIREVSTDSKGNKRSPLEIYKTIEPLLQHIPEAMRRVIENIYFSDIVIVWYISGPDAAKTAIKVGQCYAGFHAAIALLTPPFNFRFKQIEFLPNYTTDSQLSSRLSAVVTTTLLPLIITALWLLTKLKKKPLQKAKKKNNSNGKEQVAL